MLNFYLLGLNKTWQVAKKIFLIVATFFVVISLFIYFINKDKPKTPNSQSLIEKNREEVYKVINDKQLNSTKEGKAAISLYRASLCGLIGEACTDNPSDGDKNFNHSIFGFLTNLIVLPYTNPPASGVYWAYSGLQNAGFIPKTYAAEGIGFGAIKPLMNVWRAFRDVSFMLLVLVLIAIGFMIMFRAKINPQTVISVENALPKIITTLILINFSYAIAGFLIDLMYIIIAIIISIFANISGFNVSSTIGKYLTASPGNLFESFFGVNTEGFFANFLFLLKIPYYLITSFTGALGYVIIFLVYALFTLYISPTLILVVSPMIKGYVPSLQGGLAGFIGVSWNLLQEFVDVAIGKPLSIILALLLSAILFLLITALLMFLTIVFLFFRVILLLFSSYLKIILLIIFSPLIILLNALPGQSPFNFESWLKNLLAELLTFPIVITIFLTGSLIINVFSTNNNLFTPPFLIGVDPKALVFILGAGLLFMTPDLVKTFKELILPKPMPLPSVGPGVFFSGLSTAFEGGLAEAGKWGSTMYHFQYIAPIINKVFGTKLKVSGSHQQH